jgi:hypothetical protein
VVGPKNPLAVGKSALEQWDRLAQPPCGFVAACEVISRDQSIGVVEPEDLLAVGEDAFEEPDRLTEPPCRVVSDSKTTA